MYREGEVVEGLDAYGWWWLGTVIQTIGDLYSVHFHGYNKAKGIEHLEVNRIRPAMVIVTLYLFHPLSLREIYYCAH